jgi:HAD superfamily hydrolase (TIGR01509 family)
MIDVLVVDLGGVAARFLPERRLKALATLSGIAPEMIQQRLFASGLELQSELGRLEPHKVLANVQTALGTQVPVDALIDAWASAFEPNVAILNYVRSLPMRRVLFTNNGPMLDACLVKPLRDIAATFDVILCSWHVRARKPERAAFDRAIERLGLPPDHLLLFDDTIANVEAAISCGWHAARVTTLREARTAIEKHLT